MKVVISGICLTLVIVLITVFIRVQSSVKKVVLNPPTPTEIEVPNRPKKPAGPAQVNVDLSKMKFNLP